MVDKYWGGIGTIYRSLVQSVKSTMILHNAQMIHVWPRCASSPTPACLFIASHLGIAEFSKTSQKNTRHSPNAGSMLGHRRRRWSSIEPTSGGCLVFAVINLWCARPGATENHPNAGERLGQPRRHCPSIGSTSRVCRIVVGADPGWF